MNVEVHAGPPQYDNEDDEEEDREVGALSLSFADFDVLVKEALEMVNFDDDNLSDHDQGDHDDLNHDHDAKEEEVVVRGSLAKEELEQHYSVY